MKTISCGEVGGNSTGKGAGKSPWRNAGMTTDTLSGIEADLALRCRRHEDAALMARLVPGRLWPGRPASALELARSCHPPAPRPQAGAVLSALATVVPTEEVATLAALVALRPLLARIAGRLSRDGMGHDDAVSTTVAAALEVLAAGNDVAGPDVWQRLATAIWGVARTELRRDHRYRRVHTSTADLGAGSSCDGRAHDDVAETVLAWAVGCGVLELHHARLIAETRMAGRPLADVAREWEMGVRALKSVRQRAELRLRRALRCDRGLA